MKKLISLLLLLLCISPIALYQISQGDVLAKQFVEYDTKINDYKLTQKRPSDWIALSQVSREAQWAIIVSEDWAFYNHPGFDLNQITKVIKESWKQKKLVRGASTISQQVAKNALRSNDRTIKRKLLELIDTLKMERNVPKKRILEIYLNIAEFGENLYGIYNASLFYFQKSPKYLSAKEGAFLAMLLPSPVKYSVSFKERALSEYAAQTIESILFKMKQAQILNEEQMLAAKEQILSFEDAKIYSTDLKSEDDEYIQKLQQSPHSTDSEI